MDYIKELKELLETDVLLEVNENIKEIEALLAKKRKKTLSDELDYMLKVKLYFDEALEDIKNGTITQQEALDILEGLEDMKIENQDV